MNCVPLISDRPSFASRRVGSSPTRVSASNPGSRSLSTNASPSPTSGSARWASGARSPEAPTEPRLGTTGSTPRSSSREQLDRLDARTGVSLCKRVGPQQHRRAHDLVGIRLADTARMGAEQTQLELSGQLFRDRAVDETAEPVLTP